MDTFTYEHLLAWIERQFGYDDGAFAAAMLEQYENDPEIYAREGWWRCHDDMVRDGRTTL